MTQWELQGRFAVSAENDGGQADIIWKQNDSRYDIRVIYPFGQGGARVEGDESGVWLKTDAGDTHWAEDAENLLTEITQLHLPVEGLRYWMLGMPLPEVKIDSQEYDVEGRLRVLAQQGWRITIERYQKVQDVDLPQKLLLTRNGGARLDVKMIVREWTLISAVVRKDVPRIPSPF